MSLIKSSLETVLLRQYPAGNSGFGFNPRHRHCCTPFRALPRCTALTLPQCAFTLPLLLASEATLPAHTPSITFPGQSVTAVSALNSKPSHSLIGTALPSRGATAGVGRRNGGRRRLRGGGCEFLWLLTKVLQICTSERSPLAAFLSTAQNGHCRRFYVTTARNPYEDISNA